MGLISSIVRGAGPGAAARPPDDHDSWYPDASAMGLISGAGVRITPELAMNVSGVWACVKVLAETFAQVPLIVYERKADGSKERATNHPLYDLLHDAPNAWQTAFEFREFLMVCLALRGNAFAEIVPGPRGFADQLLPLHPDRVTRVEQLPSKRLLYHVTDPGGGTRRLTQDEVIHIRGMSFDGIVGISPIAAAREAIGVSLAAERQAAVSFRNAGRPAVVLKHPKVLTKEAMANIEASWRRNYGGENTGGAALLQEGMDIQVVSLTAKDSQWLETRQFQLAEIARWFRMQAHKIGDLSRSTNNNIEHQGIEFTTDTMMPWFVRAEQAFSRDLLIAPKKFFIRHLVDGLMRGDTKSRFDAYRTGIEGGFMTRQQARDFEDWNRIDGLDAPLMPLNMAPVGQLPAPAEPEPPTPPEPPTEEVDDEP